MSMCAAALCRLRRSLVVTERARYLLRRGCRGCASSSSSNAAAPSAATAAVTTDTHTCDVASDARASQLASSPSPSSSPSSSSLVPVLDVTDVCALTSAVQVECIFCDSVVARTVSNAQLRRFLARCDVPRDMAVLQAAVRGAQRGGLRLTVQTYELLIDKLLAAGQAQQAFALFHDMLAELHMRPSAQTFALLMQHCMQRQAYPACQSLFDTARRIGVRPTSRVYALYMASLAATVPSQWQAVVAVFDDVARRRPHLLDADVYAELLRAHLNRRPFDWRAVHACYCEMRSRTSPVVPLRWSNYLLVREALRRGRVSYVSRAAILFEAWAVTTPMYSVEFVKVCLLYATGLFVLRGVLGFLLAYLIALRTRPPAA